MDKPTESRSQGSADNQKFDQIPHLSDEQLLLVLDGELSTHEAAQVEVHLRSCWSCRVRREQIEEAIEDVVEYRDHLFQPYFPIPASGRSMFLTRLEQLAVSIDQPPLWKRILRGLRVLGAVSRVELPRYAWIGALILGILTFFSFAHLWQVPKVSASELLKNAQSFEVRAIQSVAKPVVYQKLSISVGSQSVTRTIYRDLIGMRQADHLEVTEGTGEKLSNDVGLLGRPQDQSNVAQTAAAELRRIFSAARLHWEDPLSPAHYSAWHKSLDEKVDEVTMDGKGFMTLKTTTSEGPIREGSITVRSKDFHLVGEDLQLQDGRLVELHELAWNVIPMDAINVAIFEPEPTLYNLASNRPPSVAVEPSVVTDSDLAEAELRARVAIHAAKADLGEQIELDRDIPRFGQPSVMVRGIVSSEERKNELLAALQGIPRVELRFQTMEEARPQPNQVPIDKSQGVVSQIAHEAPTQEHRIADGTVERASNETAAIVIKGRPAFEQQLEQRFPLARNRIAFVNETVDLLQGAMAQVWALRRLTNRYTPDMITELSAGSRQTLELLIRDHVSVLRQDVDELRVRISPLLSSEFNTVPLSAGDAQMPSEIMTSDWRRNVMNVFSEIQKVNDNGTALFGESTEALPNPRTVVHELLLAFESLEIKLPALCQQVRGPFLNVQ